MKSGEKPSNDVELWERGGACNVMKGSSEDVVVQDKLEEDKAGSRGSQEGGPRNDRQGRAEARCPVEMEREKHVWEAEKSHNT